MARKDIWKEKRNPWTWLGYTLAILLLIYMAYLVYNYYSTAENVEEFEACYTDKCVKMFHIHTTISIELCGNKITLPKETGPLDGPHTHKQKNYIHFHERLEYDKNTGAMLNTTPLLLGTLMNVLDIRFNERCIKDYCNGMECKPGSPGNVRMYVNDEPITEFDKYVWKDGDEIKITFN